MDYQPGLHQNTLDHIYLLPERKEKKEKNIKRRIRPTEKKKKKYTKNKQNECLMSHFIRKRKGRKKKPHIKENIKEL